MPATGIIRGSGQKFRTRSDTMTAAVVVTGELAWDQVNLTTDRYSYFRFPGASYLGQRCRGRWPPQRRGPKGPRLYLSAGTKALETRYKYT